ncbi:MAG: CHRD domain-containing protein [Bryobacteraceae bacterium]|nr:CHRD domain-containing protein [Bryobacteraceae bacterium]
MKPVTRIFIFAAAAASLCADSNEKRLSAPLSGYQEVLPVSTPAQGRFQAQVNGQETSFSYELEYSGLSAPVVMAHIHFAQPAVNGSIVVWLCGTAAAPGPSGTPTCPASGKVSGTVTAAQVGSTAQGILQGELAELLAAMRAGATYVNIHTTAFPGGEIRGQINDRGNGDRGRGGDDDDDDDDDGNGKGKGKDRN